MKTVTERSTGISELLEPTPNFDCHVSKAVQNLDIRAVHSQVYESSQVCLLDLAAWVGGYDQLCLSKCTAHQRGSIDNPGQKCWDD